MQMTAPGSVSTVYSEANMQLSLVTAANAEAPCSGAECELDRAFDQRVLQLGSRLAQAAFEAYPDLAGRLGGFEFIIAEKTDAGCLSSAAGRVILFRGVQKLQLDEQTLGFLIAREMGHVIGHHHDENAATGIWFSVLAAVFMPVTSIISGSAALTQSAATSTAASSAASFIGSRITIASYKQDQLREADAIALNLLERMGWRRSDVAAALVASARVMGGDTWSEDLRASAADVASQVAAPNSITALDAASAGHGETLITVGLARPLDSVPSGFATDDPPRIVFDFPNTLNGLGGSSQDFRDGDLHGINVIQSDGRTRLAISLNRALSYSASIEGNNLLVSLRDKAMDVAVVGDASRLAATAPTIR